MAWACTKVPQVLLLGNGINLAYEGISWNRLLANLSGDLSEDDVKAMKIPEPLKAILVTDDHLGERMKHAPDFFVSKGSRACNEFMKALLPSDFDCILTTNYTYELEEAALNLSGIKLINALKRNTAHIDAVTRAESEYLLHTYHRILFEGKDRHIWHIHGELRKADSMVLGHYYYGDLLFRMKKYLDEKGNHYLEK